MTPDIESLVARLIQRGGIELPNFPAPYPESLMLEAADALRNHSTLDAQNRETIAALRGIVDTQAGEISAEKAAHWKTCQTAAHEAEERDRLREQLGQAIEWMTHDTNCVATYPCSCGLNAFLASLGAEA